MGSENERVKTLLMDTVTLLCKNSLKYQHELCIEGLLGIKLDMNDVFFVHISEKFTKQGCDSLHEKRDPDGARLADDRSNQAIENERSHNGNQNNNSSSKDVVGNQDLEESNIQSDELNKSALLAGQRRAPRKPSSPHRNVTNLMYPVCTSTLSSTPISDSNIQPSSLEYASRDESGNFAVFDNSKQGHFEAMDQAPPAKRHKENQTQRNENTAEPSIPQHSQAQSQTPWPNIAGQIELPNQSGQYLEQVDINSVTNSNSLVQPGCSTWTSQPQTTTHQATDTVSQFSFI